jgi:hypothetical protein
MQRPFFAAQKKTFGFDRKISYLSVRIGSTALAVAVQVKKRDFCQTIVAK